MIEELCNDHRDPGDGTSPVCDQIKSHDKTTPHGTGDITWPVRPPHPPRQLLEQAEAKRTYDPGNPPPEFGDWKPGPESWTEDEQLPKLGLPVPEPSPADAVFGTDTAPAAGLFTWSPDHAVPVGSINTPEYYAEQAQQLRNEQYAKAGLPMPGDAAAGVLKHLLAGVVAATGSIRTQEEFLTALDELLDHTLHAEGCYIDPNDTTCVCVIGKVRAVMPRCEARGTAGTLNGPQWRCVRSVHPASPDRHVFG